MYKVTYYKTTRYPDGKKRRTLYTAEAEAVQTRTQRRVRITRVITFAQCENECELTNSEKSFIKSEEIGVSKNVAALYTIKEI